MVVRSERPGVGVVGCLAHGPAEGTGGPGALVQIERVEGIGTREARVRSPE